MAPGFKNSMPSIVLVGLLLVGLSHDIAAEQNVEASLVRVEEELDLLTSRVFALSRNLDSFLEEADGYEFTTKRLTREFDEFKGKRGACKERFFPCGPGPDGAVQCVRDYLVCDGSADCKNGADEDASICNTDNFLFGKPITIQGTVIRDTCPSQKKMVIEASSQGQNVFNWTIPGPARILPWFPSRPQVTWVMESHTTFVTDRVEVSFPNSGVYDYATGDVIIKHNPVNELRGSCKLLASTRRKIMYHCELDTHDTVLTGGKVCHVVQFALIR